MCGRYYLDFEKLVSQKFSAEGSVEFETNYNITPQSRVPIIIDESIRMATWGFFPDWLKKQKNSKPLFNTRWETINEKRTFQTAYKKNRCLIPLSGWYEWKNENNEKHPYFFYGEEDLVYAAGLYWKRSSGDIEFSIITHEAYEDLLTIHNRTPLLLNINNRNRWSYDSDVDLLYDEISNDKLISVNFHKVSKSVNNPKNKNSSLIEKYTEVPF